MGFHTSGADRATKPDNPARFRFISREELPLHLDVAPERVVTDLGSGTGFFTDEAAPHVGTLYVADVQAVMYDYYREKGASDNVEFVMADVTSLPFDDSRLDVAFSTMTYREFTTDEALAELACVICPGGTVVVVDWFTSGPGKNGPSRDERFGFGDIVPVLEAIGFTVIHGETRRETFACVARR